MRPWEEEWKASGLTFVDTADGRGVLSVAPAPVARIKEVQTFVRAAPKMARALLAQGYRHDGKWHTAVCHEYSSKGCSEDCVGARAALIAAGVPLDDP